MRGDARLVATGFVLLVSLAAPSPTRAQGAAPGAGPAVSPALGEDVPKRPGAPVLTPRKLKPMPQLNASWPSGVAPGMPRAAFDPDAAPLTRGGGRGPFASTGPGQAFAQELRYDALNSRRVGVYATIPYELPELLEDDFIREQRSEAAESLIGSAFEAALGNAMFGKVRSQHSVSVRPMVTHVESERGLRLDASPSWSWRRIAPRSGMRVDLPMTPSSFRLHSWRELKGTDRNPQRVGAGLSIDPFDDSLRAAFTFEF